eukprot:s2330_g6.t1
MQSVCYLIQWLWQDKRRRLFQGEGEFFGIGRNHTRKQDVALLTCSSLATNNVKQLNPRLFSHLLLSIEPPKRKFLVVYEQLAELALRSSSQNQQKGKGKLA